ncbi:MAG: DUF559 domain-containing protein [Pseudonocardia sp.]
MFDPTIPFRGSSALAAGHLTRGVLHGPRFVRLLPDVHVAAGVDVDLRVRAFAAHALVGATGVLAGYAAAELLGASCAPGDAPAEVLLHPPRQRRSHPGLRVRRDVLGPGECTTVAGVVVTTPLRTAYDLGRWAACVTEAVVALDALVRYRELRLDRLNGLAGSHAPARGVQQLRAAVALARPGADSPMETRLRLALVHGGLPEPSMRHPVTVAGRTFLLDLAYSELLLAIEYDGAEHRTAERARRDLRREALLAAAGWTVLRFSAADVLHRPWYVARRVRHELARRERALQQRAG